MLTEADYNDSFVIKKKKSPRTNQEPVHNKKKKKKKDDQETLTEPKKRKHLIEEGVPGGEEENTVKISNKKKRKKDSKVNEEVALGAFPYTEDKDEDINDEEHDHLEPKETFCKPKKSERRKKKDGKIVLLTEADSKEELQRLCPEKISTKKMKIKQCTAQDILHQIEALSDTHVNETGDACVNGKTKKKKKKKKQQCKEVSIEGANNHLEANEETLCKDEYVKKKHKKKRSKDHLIDGRAQTYLEPNDETSCKPENSKKNHKKKRCNKNSIYDEQHNYLEPKDEASCEPENSKKKKKKNKLVLPETEVKQNEELQTGSREHILTKKKKTKHFTAEQSAHQLLALSESVLSGSEDIYKQKLKKKKKKRQDNDEMVQIGLPQPEMENAEWQLAAHNLTSICNKKKKKKKKKMVFQAHDNIAIISDTLPNKDTQDCGKSANFNNIKRHMLDDTAPNEIPKSKKKKDIKLKEKSRSKTTECGGEVEVVSVKKGNTDEVQIDQDSRFGQWQTATFENPDQKKKFLRLMGGFKKFSPTSASSPAGTEKPNQALSRIGEEQLKQNLLSEFEKALDLKQHRGTGLGFQAATRKTFYIDKSRSNSVKFED